MFATNGRADQVPIVVHPGVRELGTDIPENQARSLHDIVKVGPFTLRTESAYNLNLFWDQDKELTELPRFAEVDFSLLPENWPENGRRVNQGESVFSWLRRAHPSVRRVAIVTHHNFICKMIGGGSVENAEPIECVLDERGFRLLGSSTRPGSTVSTMDGGHGGARPPKSTRRTNRGKHQPAPANGGAEEAGTREEHASAKKRGKGKRRDN